jgi:hypothetical protein
MNHILKPIKYLIHNDKHGFNVTIDATKFDEDNNPISWAIRLYDSAMSKKDGIFCHELRPSDRTQKYFKEFRFSSPEEALASYRSFGYKEIYERNDNPNFQKLKKQIKE